MAGQGGNGAEGRAPATLSEGHGGTPPDPLIGQTIDGRYRIEARIGEGGMGMVYRGTHTSLGKRLAIKILRPEVSRNHEIVERFRLEAQSASNIGNQHIIDIYDFGVLQDGSTYFVMEFLEGQSLAAALAGSRFTIPRTLHIVRQLCSALGAAHERGIVHRDIKPDNVQLVRRGGDPDFVKVLDFGIAKVGGSKSKLTQAGQVFGTPHYMSPEQCAGSSVDLRTDIYAVGIMMYEMVTGQVPFDADNMMGILTKHLYERPPSPRELAPPKDVPAAIEAIILKCLQKKPEARYQNMAELLADVNSAAEGETPRAMIERLERSTRVSARPSEPADLSLSRSGMTFGVGQPRIPTRSRLPLLLGALISFAVVASGLQVALRSDDSAEGGGGRAAGDGEGVPEAKPAPLAPDGVSGEGAPPGDRGGSGASEVREAPGGRVVIDSIPGGAEVLQGDRVLGTTPHEIAAGARSGPLRLTLKLDGYAEQTMVVGADTYGTVTATLAPRPPTKRSSRPSAPKRVAPAAPKAQASPKEPVVPKAPSPPKSASQPAPPPASKKAPSPSLQQPGSEVIDPWD